MSISGNALVWLTLLTIGVYLPVTTEAKPRLSSEQYYDAQARYRHRHSPRHKYKHRSCPDVVVPDRPRTPAIWLASDNMGPVDWQEVDVSEVLRPMQWAAIDPGIDFPKPRTEFKIPEYNPVVTSIQDNSIYKSFVALLILILGVGILDELKKRRTCHKSTPHGITWVREKSAKPWRNSGVWLRWVSSLVKRILHRLSELR